jgi:hypothetical protein
MYAADLLIQRPKREYRKQAEVTEMEFPEFSLRKIREVLNPEFVPSRQVENFPSLRRGPRPPQPDLPSANRGDAPDPKKPHAQRTEGNVKAGADPASSASQDAAISTTAGQNLLGRGNIQKLNVPKEGIKIKSERLPDGEGTLRPDGVVVDKNGVEYPPGSRENPIANNSQDIPPRQPPDTDAKSQHSEENMKKSKGDLANKMMLGVMLVPAFLPLALMLAGMIQGEVACKQLDGKEFKIESATSARQPVYPDGTPDWIKNTFSINKTKVKIGFSPCAQILRTDSIKVHDSNVFDGTYDITNVNGSCSLTVDIEKEFETANAFSNTAQFILNTSCSDRMAYAVGDDARVLASGVGTGLGSIVSGIFGGINMSAIFLVMGIVIAIWFIFQVYAVFKK